MGGCIEVRSAVRGSIEETEPQVHACMRKLFTGLAVSELSKSVPELILYH